MQLTLYILYQTPDPKELFAPVISLKGLTGSPAEDGLLLTVATKAGTGLGNQ